MKPDATRFEDSAPTARVCKGCGKPRGCIPIAGNGYWHLKCWRAYKAEGG